MVPTLSWDRIATGLACSGSERSGTTGDGQDSPHEIQLSCLCTGIFLRLFSKVESAVRLDCMSVQLSVHKMARIHMQVG